LFLEHAPQACLGRRAIKDANFMASQAVQMLQAHIVRQQARTVDKRWDREVDYLPA
jgi:hypothetical protein